MSKVLVVIDMQNDFIDGALGTAEAVSIVPAVVDKIKHYDGAVVYTRDTHQEDYLETQEGRALPVKHCIEGTRGWELQKEIDSLRKKAGSTVYNKNTFGSKDLAQQLVVRAAEEGIERIEMIGVCTDICVISNALTVKAFLPEVKITVDASLCAGATPEGHRNALKAMQICQIEIQNA